MDFRNYWSSLDDDEKEEFARNSGYSAKYINTHLIYRRKSPPIERIDKLATASNGSLGFYQLCDFFANRNNS